VSVPLFLAGRFSDILSKLEGGLVSRASIERETIFREQRFSFLLLPFFFFRFESYSAFSNFTDLNARSRFPPQGPFP